MSKLKKLYHKFFPAEQDKRVKPWFAADGDVTHRLDYNELKPGSVVVDLGGYKGQWASDIYGKYRCKVFVFEPARVYFQSIQRRFKNNDDISAYPYALGNDNHSELIYYSADGTSTIKKEGSSEEIVFRKFDEMMRELSIGWVELLKINIEGGEYDLLDYIISTNWIYNIRNIQVQFHDFVPNARQRMEAIQKKLAKTHSTTYQFEFVWENWKIKEETIR